MDAISSAGVQPQYRSWNTNLLKQLGTGKQNFIDLENNAHRSASVDKNSPEYAKFQEQLSNSDSLSKRTMASTNQIFADGTATSTVDSIEAFFKHGNLQNTVGIFSNAGMHDAATSQGAVSFLSPELSDTDLSKGAGGLSVSTKQGTTVNVRRDNTNPNTPGGYQLTISRPDGLELAFESNDNMRITDLEDGGLSIFYASTGETHIYDAEGNKKDVLQGEAGALTGTDGDDLLINLNGTQVDGGDGDDTIVNFADNATINGGNGDDTILLGRTVANNIIDAGEGNDHLLGLGAHKGSSIDMGGGDNRVQLGYLGSKSELTASDGNNDITIGVVNNSLIHLGNGNNAVHSHMFSGTMQFGDGNNAIVSDTISGSIVSGNGDNSVLARYMTANINFGDSNNTVKADSIDGSEMNLGGGNNTVKADSIDGLEMNLGGGNNTVKADSINGSEMNLGGGNNTVKADSINGSEMNLGGGNNTVKADSIYKSDINLGNGNNTVTADSFVGQLFGGNGNNTIDIQRVGSLAGGLSSTILLGHGNNIINIDSSSLSDIILGNGNNKVDLRSSHATNTVFGNGDNSVTMDTIFKSTVVNGDGDNTIHVRCARDSSITTGTGRNDVSVKQLFSANLIDGNDAALMKALKAAAFRRDISLNDMRGRGFVV